jgi:pimeloyl-ACP methyl ester carboxylesterase
MSPRPLETSQIISLLLTLTWLACSGMPARAAGDHVKPFYAATSAELSGPPGSIIRLEPWDLHTAYWVRGYRILYRSTGLDGRPIAVSGAVLVPQFPVPSGGRPILAWAHPTTGVAVKCAPSLSDSLVDDIPGITDMIPKGYVIVATDYPGLGTAGPHPYLIGVSEGRAILDSVRAVKSLAEAKARNEFAIWGHSQGGHAALWAGQIAPSYAPELKLVGVAAAAPATELAALFDLDDNETAGKILASMALVSWSGVFGIPLQSVLLDKAIPVADRIGTDCIDTLTEAIGVEIAEHPLQRKFLKADPTETEPWQSLMRQNTPGGESTAAPVFIAQGSEDKIVRPQITSNFVAHLCGKGGRVTFAELPGVDHMLAARKSASTAIAWIDERFHGLKPRSTCSEH